MTEFKKPVISKKSDRQVNEKGVVIELAEVSYEVNGNIYPKLQIKTFKLDSEGFPISSPKTLNLPVDCKDMLLNAFDSLE